VALFSFVSWCLTIIAVVTVIWPLNIPLAALAYKVRLGYRPLTMERRAFWWRCTFATLSLAGMTLVLLGPYSLLYALVEGAEFKPNQVQLVLLMAYVPAAVWVMFIMFAYEDMLEALSLFLLYILLPGLPLLLFGNLTGFWDWLATQTPWLMKP
jgi:hypothetical protein